MDDLQFYALFNSISVISGQDNERHAMELSLHEKISPQAGLKLGTARFSLQDV